MANSAFGGGGSAIPSTQTILLGSGTYTPPAGCTALMVECVGGGGGGGGHTSAVGGGGGGGGGAYSRKLITSPAASYTYSAGAGGAGGATTPTAGSTGGDTSFGTGPLVLAKGGLGGGASSGTAAGGAGGAAASGIGDFKADGGGGAGGLSASGGGAVGGSGGASVLGGGGPANSASTSINAGQFGGGGSGPGGSNNAVGGSGAIGVIVVTEFYAAFQGTPTIAGLSTLTAQVPTDVAMGSINTFYDGPSLSLTAGTWLLTASLSITAGGSGGPLTAKLWDGTTAVASSHAQGGNGVLSNLALVAIVTVASTTTYKASVATTTGTATIKAAASNNPAGNNASTLVAVKLA